jgi:cytochrome oxidase Cu insertion factor (SCO1/SenC/PrrC family)
MRRALALIVLGAASVTFLTACSSGPSQGKSGGTSAPTVGASAPGFSLASAQGDTISLDQFRGNKPVLLYFSMGPG